MPQQLRPLNEAWNSTPTTSMPRASSPGNWPPRPTRSLRDAVEARRLAEFAFSQNAGNPLANDTLAAAMAESGIYSRPSALAETALKLLQDEEDKLRGAIIERRDLYLASQPYRQTAPSD